MTQQKKYIPTIGLEIHVQLLTKSKMFSTESTCYGSVPNTQTSPVTLAHPGTMPSINQEAIEATIKMALGCYMSITRYNLFARKNYFYPDLAKGYQITQHTTPLSTHGYMMIHVPHLKKIRIRRIHIEEDTAKSLHGMMLGHTLLDFNRAGSALIEIVTEPDISTSKEAYEFISKIRRLVRYLDISDGNMEEGSLRCDANVSVRKEDDKNLGQKVEIKNMNSMRHVQKAIEYEIKRQIKVLENKRKIIASTRAYDAVQDITIYQRQKESLGEYRYFPEPDLSPIIVDEAWIKKIQNSMPALPWELAKKFSKSYKLSDYAVNVLIEDKSIALFFDTVCQYTVHYKPVANWIMGPVKSYLNTHKIDVLSFPIGAEGLAKLVNMVQEGLLSFSVASTKLLPFWLQHPKKDVYTLAKDQGLLDRADKDKILDSVRSVLNKYPDKVAIYKKGKIGLMGFFIGQVMKLSKGKADPKQVRTLLEQCTQD